MSSSSGLPTASGVASAPLPQLSTQPQPLHGNTAAQGQAQGSPAGNGYAAGYGAHHEPPFPYPGEQPHSLLQGGTAANFFCQWICSASSYDIAPMDVWRAIPASYTLWCRYVRLFHRCTAMP